MTPSDAVRAPRFAACAWPFTRRISIALSTSPFASTRAPLQSIIPAPVRSRSSFTSLAEMVASAMSARSFHVVGVGDGGRFRVRLRLGLLAAAWPLRRLVDGRLLVALGALDLLASGLLSGRLGLLAHLGAARHVRLGGRGRGRCRLGICGGLGTRCCLGLCALGLLLGGALLGLLALALLGLALRLCHGLDTRLLLGLLAGGLLLGAELRVALADDIGYRVDHDLARADRVVVAGDRIRDGVWVDVGVDEPDDRDAQALGLAHADGLGLEVDDEDRVGRTLHVAHAAEVRGELLALGQRVYALTRRQQLERAVLDPCVQVVEALDPLRDRLEVG